MHTRRTRTQITQTFQLLVVLYREEARLYTYFIRVETPRYVSDNVGTSTESGIMLPIISYVR